MLAALLALMLAAAPAPQEVVAGSGEVPARAVAAVQAAVADRLAALRPLFPDLAIGRFTVFVHGSIADLPVALRPCLHPGSPAFALLGRHQIHVVWGELRNTGAKLPGVVAHELVHELLDQFAAPDGAMIPRWFHEGLAQHLAGDTYLGAREEDLIWRIGARRLLSFADLRERFPDGEDDLRTAYAQSYSYVSWLVRRHGLGDLLAVVRNTGGSTTFERALVGRTGRTTLELADGWRYHLQHESGAILRVLLDQCFNLLLIASLPVLVLAFRRRFLRERRTAERLARAEAEERARALPAAPPEPPEPPEPPQADEREDEPGEDEHEDRRERSP